MAREWRRETFAVLAAAMLAGACALGPQAQAANEPEEGQAQEAPDNQSPDTPDTPAKGGKKRQDPAEAQRAIETALKHLQAGHAEQAVQAMTTTLSGGNLPPAIMAKAFYVRGAAHRQLGRPAQAISDLNGALWLKGGLGGEDRTEATRERAAAYRDAGLGGPRDSDGPAPKSSGNWLSGLFGSSTPSSEPAARPPTPPRPAARIEAPAPARPPAAVSTGWSSKTEVQPDRPALAAAAPPKAAAPAARVEPPPAAKMEGRYLIQLAAVRTEAQAQALVAKARRDPALASRRPAIDHAVVGNMGAFYLVRFGPFASAEETESACAKLQGSGFDCLPVGP